MVGTMGLLVEDYGRKAMLTGLVLLPDAPVRGHGHEAGRLLTAYGFGLLGLHRVWAGHRADHTRMHEVMLAAGLRPEATLRELFHTQGRRHDVTTSAARALEWRRSATRAEQTILAGQSHPPAGPRNSPAVSLNESVVSGAPVAPGTSRAPERTAEPS
jgi:ribosomal-protein-alanine N-acetyltransferase